MPIKQRFSLRKKTIGLVSVLLGFWVAGAVGQTVTFAESDPAAVTEESVPSSNISTDGTTVSQPEKNEGMVTQPVETVTSVNTEEAADTSRHEASEGTEVRAAESTPIASHILVRAEVSNSSTPEADVETGASNESSHDTVTSLESADEETTIRNSEVTAPTGNNVMVGLRGSFETPDKEAILKRLNEIRKEAVDLGLEARYVPLQWSNDLEDATMIRAAEAAVTIAHKRLNGERIYSASNKLTSATAENLAWNWSKDGKGILDGIEQWYGEKEDYIYYTQTGIIRNQIGHYKSMINSNYTTTAISDFRGNYKYLNSVAQWLSSASDTSPNVTRTYGDTIQLTEAKSDQVAAVELQETSMVLAVNTTKDIPLEGNFGDQGGILITEGYQWTSSNPSVATVVNGKISAATVGQTKLSSTINGKDYSINVTVVDPSKDDLSAMTSYKTEEIPYTIVKSGDDAIERNVRQTVTAGVNGTKRITTAYILNAKGQIEKK